MGYVYILSCIISGLSALLIAQFAMGGIWASIGFTIMALLWLGSTISATKAVLNGRIRDHEHYMIYSYAMTFVAIPQRLMLLIPLLFGVPFLGVYILSAWLPWILNLWLAYMIIRKSM